MRAGDFSTAVRGRAVPAHRRIGRAASLKRVQVGHQSHPAVARGDEYLWGRDILVAPVVEKGAKSRRVYLPAGTWFGTELASGASHCLVGCTVAPGFEFADFELAEGPELEARYPDAADRIVRDGFRDPAGAQWFEGAWLSGVILCDWPRRALGDHVLQVEVPASCASRTFFEMSLERMNSGPRSAGTPSTRKV